MKIIFLGTPGFSVEILKGILKTQHEVVAVVTKTDKVNCRNNKTKFCALKQFAIENNLPLKQYKSINKEGEAELKSLNPDLIITACYGQILKNNILKIAGYGVINVHGSLLPEYRGSCPIQWSLINGEKQTGVTVARSEAGIDCGEIFLQKSIKIDENDNAVSLFEKAAELGSAAIQEFLNDFDSFINNGKAQDEAKASYFPMLKNEDALIDFNKPAKEVVGKIKGYALIPAYFIYNGKRFNIYNAKEYNLNNIFEKEIAVANKISSEDLSSGNENKATDKNADKHLNEMQNKIEPSEILFADGKRGLIVGVVGGAVQITQMQPENKRIMGAKECMNGAKFIIGDKI